VKWPPWLHPATEPPIERTTSDELLEVADRLIVESETLRSLSRRLERQVQEAESGR
jgi:hypothetical protein